MPEDTYFEDILVDWSKQLDAVTANDGWDYEDTADSINQKYAALFA